jgi:hypothetical protein
MGEVIGLLAVGAAFGALVGTAFAWDRGFQAGVSWAMHHYWGDRHD